MMFNNEANALIGIEINNYNVASHIPIGTKVQITTGKYAGAIGIINGVTRKIADEYNYISTPSNVSCNTKGYSQKVVYTINIPGTRQIIALEPGQFNLYYEKGALTNY